MRVFRKQRDTHFFDHKKSKKILEELKEQVDEKLKGQKSNWLHVTRMNKNRMPKIMQNCRPNGRRRGGRNIERLIEKAETRLASFDVFLTVHHSINLFLLPT
jgi:hypothetical protein